MLGAKKLPTATAPLAEFTCISYLQLPEEPMECVILQWWAAREATFPTVSKMAIQYLGAPAAASLLHLLQLRGCPPVLVGTTAPLLVSSVFSLRILGCPLLLLS